MHLLKNANVNAPKFFFSTFSGRMLLSLKKWLYEKIFETPFPVQKVCFRCQTPLSHQEELGPQKQFFAVFLENTAFFEKKLLNNKIFGIKNVMLIFGARRPLFLKNVQMCPQ